MTLELRDYLNVLLKRWWLILLVAVVAAAVGYAISSLQPKLYQASTRILVTPSRADNGLIEFAIKNIPSYQDRLQSRDLISQALADNGLDDNPDEVKARMKVQPQPSQLRIDLTMDHPRPEQAAALLNAVVGTFVDRMNAEAASSTSQDKLILVQPELAGAPSQPYQPRPGLTAGAAAVLGLILGLVLAFVLEFLDDTLKTTDDVQRILGLTTIGLIPARK
jgi:capsular polysaccharide biosynthesis protein